MLSQAYPTVSLRYVQLVFNHTAAYLRITTHKNNFIDRKHERRCLRLDCKYEIPGTSTIPSRRNAVLACYVVTRVEGRGY